MIKYKIWAQIEKISTDGDTENYENIGEAVDIVVTKTEDLAREALTELEKIGADFEYTKQTEKVNSVEKESGSLVGELVSGISFRTSDYGRPIEVTYTTDGDDTKMTKRGTLSSLTPVEGDIHLFMECENGYLFHRTMRSATTIRFLDHAQKNTCDTLSKE
jgi:hypothetical protein